MVDCESCSVLLSDKNLQEVVDNKGKTRLICTHCKKLAIKVTAVFDTLEWPAFVQFVAKHHESEKDYKMTIPIKKEDEKNGPS